MQGDCLGCVRACFWAFVGLFWNAETVARHSSCSHNLCQFSNITQEEKWGEISITLITVVETGPLCIRSKERFKLLPL